MNVDLVADAHATVGEAPTWDESRGVLYWTDIVGRAIHSYIPTKDIDTVSETEVEICCIGKNSPSELIVGTNCGIATLNPTTGATRQLVDPEEGPDNRFNDGKVGPDGRFYAGTMAYTAATGAGALYRFDASSEIVPLLPEVTISNGLDWAPDEKTFYYIDSGQPQVLAFDFDRATGTISRRRTVVEVEGMAAGEIIDGMTVDEEGMLWVAHFGGGRVSRWDPGNGREIASIPLPAVQVTSCTFGGSDLRTLFITTAAYQLSPQELKEQPHAGGLFCCEPGVRGKASYRFGQEASAAK